MIKILVATHGDYASGALSAASIIAGEKDYVTCIDAYTKHKNLQEVVQAYFNTITEEDELIVLTDLFGGSVNQALMPYIKQDHVYVITGFNLALLLEILMMQNSTVDKSQLQAIVEGSKSQIMFVNDMVQTSMEDDFK